MEQHTLIAIGVALVYGMGVAFTEGQMLVAGAIMLCCLPAIIRWTTADYTPEPETRLKEP